MLKIYKNQKCYTQKEAQSLWEKHIYEQAEILRTNLRKSTHEAIDYA